MAEQSPSIWLTTIAVVLILIGAGVGAGLLYLRDHPAKPAGPRTVALGDNVTVNYIGVFGSGAETGRVFDTSILTVAENNLSYPKSLEYSFRSNLSQYAPLGVHVSPSTPSSGYTAHGTTFGGVVTGFWRGLVGLPGNQTHTLVLPPALAYGPTNASCLVTAPLVAHVPVTNSIPLASFSTDYPNVTRSAGTEFVDPTYHWTDLVYSLNSTSATVLNEPTVGFTAATGDWSISVTNISAGMITVTNNIAPAQAGLLLGHSTSKVCSTNAYIVSAVDPSAGTFIENFNREVVGQTLIFDVTVVDIYP